MEKFQNLSSFINPLLDFDELPEDIIELAEEKLSTVLTLVYFEHNDYIHYGCFVEELQLEDLIPTPGEVKTLIKHPQVWEKLEKYFNRLRKNHPFFTKIARADSEEDIFRPFSGTDKRVRKQGCFGLKFLHQYQHYPISLLSKLTNNWEYMSYGGLLSLCDDMREKDFDNALRGISVSYFDYTLIGPLWRCFKKKVTLNPHHYRFLYNVIPNDINNDELCELLFVLIELSPNIPKQVAEKIYQMLCQAKKNNNEDTEVILTLISNALRLTTQEEHILLGKSQKLEE